MTTKETPEPKAAIIFEASELGWKAGQWPLSFKHDGAVFRRTGEVLTNDPFTGAPSFDGYDYKEKDGTRVARVYND